MVLKTFFGMKYLKKNTEKLIGYMNEFDEFYIYAWATYACMNFNYM